MDDNQSTILTALTSLSTQVSTLSTQVSVIDKNLAINTVETSNVKDQLIKLNGKVAAHELSISTNQQAMALLTQALTLQDKNKADWKANLLDKIIWIVIGFLGIVFYTVLLRTHTVAPLSTPGTSQPTANVTPK